MMKNEKSVLEDIIIICKFLILHLLELMLEKKSTIFASEQASRKREDSVGKGCACLCD